LAIGLNRCAILRRANPEPADRPTGQKPDNHDDHRGDEPSERPAEDDDDLVFLGRNSSRPT
jgi:hypothetical protein